MRQSIQGEEHYFNRCGAFGENLGRAYAISMSDPRLREAIDTLRRGDRRQAQRLLAQVVEDDPDNLLAWWYLAAVLKDVEQRILCLRQVLRLRPDHEEAQHILSLLERRRAQITPAGGVQRPIVDAEPNTQGNLMVVRERSRARAPRQHKRSRLGSAFVMGMATIPLLAVLLAAALVLSGKAAHLLNLQAPPEPTPRPVAIGIPACAAAEGRAATLTFVNNTGVTIDVLQGEAGAETLLFVLGPDSEGSVEVTPGMTIRYAITTQAEGFSGSGALIEVPRGSACRVPIQ